VGKGVDSPENHMAQEVVTPTFYKDKIFCANRSACQIIVLVKNFPKINLA
jgi:hypothetical protein